MSESSKHCYQDEKLLPVTGAEGQGYEGKAIRRVGLSWEGKR